jgi:hypothetical protein
MAVFAVAGFGLLMVDLAMLGAIDDIPIIVHLHSYMVGVFIAGFLASLIVFVGARIVRGQRKLKADLLEQIRASFEAHHSPDVRTPDRGEPVDDPEGLTPDMLAVARNLSARLSPVR